MASGGTSPLCDEVIELMTSGVISLGTRDAALQPECVPVMGARPHRDRTALTIFVPRALAAPTLANLEDNGQVAISVTRPSDDISMQIKGRAVVVGEATDADRAAQEQFRGGLVEQLAFVGLPRTITRRMAWWPSVVIKVQVEDVFVQTPGPGAGRRFAR
jgi:hypothetical protein